MRAGLQVFVLHTAASVAARYCTLRAEDLVRLAPRAARPGGLWGEYTNRESHLRDSGLTLGTLIGKFTDAMPRRRDDRRKEDASEQQRKNAEVKREAAEVGREKAETKREDEE
jgi:hypothetical protein